VGCRKVIEASASGAAGGAASPAITGVIASSNRWIAPGGGVPYRIAASNPSSCA